MARLRTIAILAIAIPAIGLGVFGTRPAAAAASDYLVMVAGDCGAAAEQVVAETGGRLLSAEPAADGRSCKVTVLIQGNGGERPRKVTRTVSM